jgi:hypothetical protein
MFIKIVTDNVRQGHEGEEIEFVKIESIIRVKPKHYTSLWSEVNGEYGEETDCVLAINIKGGGWISVLNYSYEQLMEILTTSRMPKNLPIKRETNV